MKANEDKPIDSFVDAFADPFADASIPAQEPTDRDPMGPPEEPCECHCLHCGRTFMSNQMWFQKIVGHPRGELEGFWMCPTPNCDGAGFCFDIFPVSDEDCEKHGVHCWDDDEEDFDDEFEDFDDELDDDEELDDFNTEEEVAEYDPEESTYKELDLSLGDGEDDLIEGDEWKLGLSPGEEAPPQAYWPEGQRQQWEEEQKKYDGPDLRPREVPWSGPDDAEKSFNEDDIPF